MNEPNPIWFLVLFPFSFAGIWIFVVWILSFMSGWRLLAKAYPTIAFPDGERLPRSVVHIGFSRYKGVLHIRAGAEHLHMVPMLIFRMGHDPLSIPWSDMTATPISGAFSRQIEVRCADAPKVRIRFDLETSTLLGRASGGRFAMPSTEEG